MGLTSIVFTVAVQSGVAHTDRGRATALFFFCRLMGQALGAAAFGGVLNAGLHAAQNGAGARDVLRDLVNPHIRATMPADELLRLTSMLNGALHGVFVLGTILSLGAAIVAALVPTERRDLSKHAQTLSKP